MFLTFQNRQREERPCLRKHSVGVVETQFGCQFFHLPTPSSGVAGWEREISHSERVYTIEIGKCHTPGLRPPLGISCEHLRTPLQPLSAWSSGLARSGAINRHLCSVIQDHVLAAFTVPRRRGGFPQA